MGWTEVGEGYPHKSTQKNDRSILCRAQISVIFPQKMQSCESYRFLYFAVDMLLFESGMCNNIVRMST